MCLYLTKRGSMYYFRRVIAPELRGLLGQREYTFSLGTKDREKAKSLRSEHAVRTDRLIKEAWATLRADTSSTEAKSANTQIDGEWFGEFAQEQAEYAARQGAERERRRADRRDHRDEWRARLDGSTMQMPPRYAALHDLLREREERAAAAEARLQPLEQDKQNQVGTGGSVLPSRSTTVQGDSATVLLDRVVDLWAADRGPRRKTVDAHRAVARWFTQRAGNRPVATFSRRDVMDFKSALLAEGQKAANIKVKLSRLRTLLSWAFKHDYAAANVADGVEIKIPASEKQKRKPFDLAALRAIFGSPVFASGDRPSGGKGEAAYWIPLIGLYSGARLEEIGQLRVADVSDTAYIDQNGHDREAWTFRIEPCDEDGLKLKNEESERVVPVHGELIRLGFLKYVSSLKVAGQQWLFPLLKPNIYRIRTAKWGEWFSKYRREVCGVTNRRMVFHSFRHTFKDIARHAGISDPIQRQLMGHSSDDVADDYGSGHSLHQLVEAMANYKVPGLRLDGLAPPQ